ncbi:protein disulfide-isomerase A5-like [Diorhabda carinulata]|uniref:protein disulfide-isomerase A5-like n=1 Tax=Diorhabda carinulata TaxID=1163345 RepID=UPI0025A2B97C|nr:protein disulfide-isomerase A5-like [Diorhabda carinulata]
MQRSSTNEEIAIPTLNEANFLDFLKKKTHVIVMFMSPFCPHCKKTKPEYTKAAVMLKEDKSISFVLIDCTVSVDLCRENEVEVYPIIKYFNYSTRKEETFAGKRTAENLIAFVQQCINQE